METCSICLESLNDDQTFSLEACGHTFHTKCIVNWFRNSKSCPCCRNTPELAKQIPSFYLNERYRELRRIAKLKNAPNDLKKLVEKLKIIEEKKKDANKDLSDFRNDNKEIFKEERKLRKCKWRQYNKEREIRNRIGIYQSDNYILPNLTVINYENY